MSQRIWLFLLLKSFCDLVLVAGLISGLGHTGSTVEKHLEKLSWGRLLDSVWTSKALSAGSADLCNNASGLLPVFYSCSVYVPVTLVTVRRAAWIHLFLAILSHKISIFSKHRKPGEMKYFRAKISSLQVGISDCLEWLDFKANNIFLFQSTRNVNSCYRLPYLAMSCCYGKSVGTRVLEGRVKRWLPTHLWWNLENPDFQFVVACATVIDLLV